MSVRPLRIDREPPPKRGRLMTAQEIAAEVFRGNVTADWVRRNAPYRRKFGHNTVLWFEADVWRWVDETGAA